MQFQRIFPTEILILAPLEEVREATWFAMWSAGGTQPLIDVEKNVVSGSQGDGVLTAVRVATARFEARPEGIVVTVDSKPVLGGTIDFGAGLKSARKIVDSLERLLASGYVPQPIEAISAQPAVAPIAAPTHEKVIGNPTMIRPRYGAVLAPRRGITLLVYSVLSLLLCQIFAPLTILYGLGALKDYKRRGDPGDKGLVIAGMVISALVTLGTIGFWVLIFASK